MGKRLLVILVFALGLLLSNSVFAKIDYWKIDDIKTNIAGAKGTAYTVFQGDDPEAFDVEFVGNIDFDGYTFFLVKVSGGPLNAANETGVAAGMSGSPVYVEGKLVGAIAYGWSFTTGGIGAVTPFEYMHDEYAGVKKSAHFPHEVKFPYQGDEMVLSQIPILSRNADNHLTRELFSSLAFTSARAKTKIVPEKKLCPGCALSVHLISGDFVIDGVGTITAIDSETGAIYAFGHSFFDSGSMSQFPAYRVPITYIARSHADSFKLSGSDWRGEGAVIDYDGNFGIYGKVGGNAETIPVDISMRDLKGKSESIHFEIPYFPLTALAVEVAVSKVLGTNLDLGSDGNLAVKGRIVPQGFREIFVDEIIPKSDRYITFYGKKDLQDDKDGEGGSQFFGFERYFALLSTILSEIESVRIERLQLEFAEVEAKTFVIESAFVRNEKVPLGGSLEVVVGIAEAKLSGEARERYEVIVPLQIPKNAIPGEYGVYIESGWGFVDRNPNLKHLPGSITELIERMNGAKRSDGVYLQAVVKTGPDSEDFHHAETGPSNGEPAWKKTGTPSKKFKEYEEVLVRSEMKSPVKDAVIGGVGRFKLDFVVVDPPVVHLKQRGLLARIFSWKK
ncbi:MAG: hypothetical protein AAB495_02365 [Patescibacteria group bacterium]